MRRLLAAALLPALLFLGCGASSLRPAAYPDPEVRCPGGLLTWGLEIRDLRADRSDSERVTSLIRASLAQSFPDCRWQNSAREGTPAVSIEIHRFAVVRDGNFWESAAEWTVLARDAAGRPLTEFQSEAEVSRPNYRGANNEVEAMKGAFDQAIRRTLEGLKAVSSAG